jgi:hypothetical protein
MNFCDDATQACAASSRLQMQGSVGAGGKDSPEVCGHRRHGDFVRFVLLSIELVFELDRF